MKHHGNSGPDRAKPPYRGDVAFRMGWPCEPPYQMKRAKKSAWIKAWLFAQEPNRFSG